MLSIPSSPSTAVTNLGDEDEEEGEGDGEVRAGEVGKEGVV